MAWLFPVYLALLFIAALLAVGLAIYSLLQQRVPGGRSFACVMLAGAWWSGCAAIAAVSPSPAAADLWFFKIRFAGVVSLPVFWLIFALEYAGMRRWLTARNVLGLFVVPAITMWITWTAGHLIFQENQFDRIGSFLVRTRFTPGPWFWVHTIYCYTLVLIGMVVMAIGVSRSFSLYRWQAILLLIGTLIPIAGNVLVVFKLVDPGIDVASVGMAMTGVLWTVALFRHGLIRVIPVARDALVAEMSDAAVVLDPEDSIIEMNPAALVLFGAPANVVGSSLAEALPMFAGAVVPHDRDAREKLQIELDAGGNRRILDVQVSPLRGADAGLVGRLLIIRDVTEATRLLDDLDAYARVVAHDLKNPIGVIRGYAELLKGNLADTLDEEGRELLAGTLDGCDRMNRIVDELLLFARVRTSDTVAREPLDMAHIVAEALVRLAREIEESRARIETPNAWVQAVGYPPWVEEVWVNYISNALKYGGAPPHVTLGAEEKVDGRAHFWVRDNGAGLSPDQTPRLFQEFSRLAPGRGEGHGLGLSIVKRIVERLGGEVTVTTIPGHGSTFGFTLPMERNTSLVRP